MPVTVLWLVAVPALMALVLWAVLHLERFALIVVLPAMIVPAALAQPSGTHIAIADVLIGCVLILWLVLAPSGHAPPLRLSRNALLVPALLFTAVSAESLSWSISQGATARFTVQIFELTVVIPVLFASLPQSANVIRRGFTAYIAASSILAVISIVVYSRHAVAGDLSGDSLPLGLQKNVTGAFLAAGLVMAYALWLAEDGRREKWKLGCATVLNTLGLFSTVSRASIIGAVVAVVCVGLLMGRRRALTLGLVCLAAAGYLMVIGVSSHSKNNIAGSYDSSTLRADAWADGVKKIGKNPGLGTGAATYSDNIQPLHVIVTDPQNLVLLTWAEMGIAGMLALGFLIARFGRLWVRSRKLPAQYRTLALAAGGVTLSWLVHSQFDIAWIRGTASIAFAMVGVILALERLAESEQRVPEVMVHRGSGGQLARRSAVRST